jgi:hypothetical protein
MLLTPGACAYEMEGHDGRQSKPGVHDVVPVADVYHLGTLEPACHLLDGEGIRHNLSMRGGVSQSSLRFYGKDICRDLRRKEEGSVRSPLVSTKRASAIICQKEERSVRASSFLRGLRRPNSSHRELGIDCTKTFPTNCFSGALVPAFGATKASHSCKSHRLQFALSHFQSLQP